MKEIQRLNLCRQCGKCCETLVLCSIDESEWEARLAQYHRDPLAQSYLNSDMRFIVEDCVRITKEAAVKKNSELSKWLAYKQDLLFFACKHVKDNKCQIYDHRPQICSGFPFYRSEATLLHTDFLLYDENCGFASLKVVSPLSEKKDFVSSAYERHEKKLQESF